MKWKSDTHFQFIILQIRYFVFIESATEFLEVQCTIFGDNQALAIILCFHNYCMLAASI